MPILSEEHRQSLQDIDDQLQHADLEAGLQDLRDLAQALRLDEVAQRARDCLVSWRHTCNERRRLTVEQYDLQFARHSDDAFALWDELERCGEWADDADGGALPANVPVPRPDSPVQAKLSCRDVTKQYARVFRLVNVSFDLQSGEVLGVVGPNGSGKTTLLRILAGELAFDVGDLALDEDVPGGRAYLRRVAYVPQRPMPWAHSVVVHLQWHAALAGARMLEVNDSEVNDVLTWLQLSAHQTKRYGELSEGLRMRVAIAAAILTRPHVLILDEPLAPLDPSSQLNLLSWIRRRTREWRGVMTILSSQHVPEVELVADQLLYLRDGRVADFPREAVTLTSGAAYEVTPRDDREGFATLTRVLESLRAKGVVASLVTCERYAVVAILSQRLPLHVFAGLIAGATPRMVRDVSTSARRPLLTDPIE